MGMQARARSNLERDYVSMDYRLALGSSSAVKEFDQPWIRG
jgi:hypothetical protein